MNKVIDYKGNKIPVRAGEWNDIMNSCFYKVIDCIDGDINSEYYKICEDLNGVIFALRGCRI